NAFEVALTCVEILRTFLQDGDLLFRLANVAQLVRKLRLGDRQLRRTPSVLLLLLGVSSFQRYQLLLALLEVALESRRRRETRFDFAPRLFELPLLGGEVGRARLQLRRACVELPRCRVVHAFFVL